MIDDDRSQRSPDEGRKTLESIAAVAPQPPPAPAPEGTTSKVQQQFLALLNHELKTPLNTALGWTQILLTDKTLSEVSRRAAEAIERSVRAQSALVDDLLDVARMVAGEIELERSNVDLAVLAEASLSAARPLAESRTITLGYQATGDSEVYGDPARLRQILDNLLGNALKFTDSGGTVEVTLEGGGGSVVLKVADTGIGMKPEVLERLFEPFSKGDDKEGDSKGAALQRGKGGLGLGLAMARRLAEAHGGTLTASSEGDAKGSLFTLSLPRPVKTIPPPRARFQPRGELKGVFALLVDDDRDNLELTAYLLEAAGCSVSMASTAAGALTALEHGKFGLLVSDIGLPDKDGLELIREIRERGFDATELPAIALTGYAGLHDARLVTAAGYQKHLTKPLDAPTLIRAATALARRTRTRTGP
jgi:CheY-like chemotaxis protein